MINFRIIPRLDIKNGLLTKGINLEGLRILGNPLDFAKKYFEDGADEICYIDIVSSLYGTKNISKFIKDTAKNNFIPLTVGGGVKNEDDIIKLFQNGADKVSINSGIVENINFLYSSAKKFGSSNITALVEIILINNKYFITTNNGRELKRINAFEWIKKIQDFGAGELIVTLVNNEGLGNGFNLSVAEKISNIIKIPFLLHGGFSNKNQILEIAKKTGASGVLISSMLHYKYINYFRLKTKKIGNYEYLKKNYLSQNKNAKNIISEIKRFLNKNKINVRL